MRIFVAALASTLLGPLVLGCYEAHERNRFPIREANVDDAICRAEGIPLGEGTFSRRFGPYSPEESTRWLGGQLAFSEEGSTLVASQDSWWGSRALRPSATDAPSTDPLLVFASARSCLRVIAVLRAPTEELGGSLGVSASGRFIAATGSRLQALPGGAVGYSYVDPHTFTFERRVGFFMSRGPEIVSALNLVQFAVERLAVAETSGFDPSFSLQALDEDAPAERFALPTAPAAFVTSRDGSFAAVLDRAGRATRIDLRGDLPRVEPTGFAATVTGIPMALTVADTGRIVVFHVEDLATVTTVLDPGEAPDTAVRMGLPGVEASTSAVAISPPGDRVAWTISRGARETRRDLIVASLSLSPRPTWTEERIPLVSPECREPWNVRSVAFASDGRLAVSAACGDVREGTSAGPRGALFVFEP